MCEVAGDETLPRVRFVNKQAVYPACKKEAGRAGFWIVAALPVDSV
jgi:hypothetical protein